MYMDKMLEMSDGQSLATLSSAQEMLSTDIIDLGASETNAFGTTILPDSWGGTLIWHVLVSTAHSGGGSAAVTVELVAKSVATSMSASGTVIDTFSIAQATTAGSVSLRRLLRELITRGRFLLKQWLRVTAICALFIAVPLTRPMLVLSIVGLI
jgi:hypothetical protein